MVVLDTNVLVALQRNHAGARRALQQQEAAQAIIRIPAIVWVEFLSAFPPQARLHAQKRLLTSAQFVAFDFSHAELAARLQHDLMAAGTRLGWSDVQVAATAIQAGEPLLSNDAGFDRVAGVQRLGF